MWGRILVQRRLCNAFFTCPGIRNGEFVSLLPGVEVGLAGEMRRSCIHGEPPKREIRPPRKTFGGNMNFIQNVLGEYEHWERQRSRTDKDIVHLTLKNKNTFVAVTDDKGNKKLGASAGSCLKDIKGSSRRRTKYAVEATAEHVGRSARSLGMKSVVVRVKGSVYFGKKKAAIMSFQKGLGSRSAITYIQDVTQLPHNGCRLRKRRRA
uniref:Ribosomal protein S11 n=1 Tax=Araucaria cunninghamii TaxID=56994 RepID=A0A0D6QTS6_ARACU